MINAEGDGIPALLTSDRKDEDRIVIMLAPKWYLAGISPILCHLQLCEFFKFDVFPSN
jgi:hypothetical protein